MTQIQWIRIYFKIFCFQLIDVSSINKTTVAFIIVYSGSTVILVSYNPSARPLPRINISLFLLLECTEEL